MVCFLLETASLSLSSMVLWKQNMVLKIIVSQGTSVLHLTSSFSIQLDLPLVDARRKTQNASNLLCNSKLKGCPGRNTEILSEQAGLRVGKRKLKWNLTWPGIPETSRKASVSTLVTRTGQCGLAAEQGRAPSCTGCEKGWGTKYLLGQWK